VYFQHDQEFFSSVYLGGGCLALAVAALFLGRDRRAWLLAVLGALGLALSFGEGSPFYRGLNALFPPLSIARYPVKFLLLTAFAASLLAGRALGALASDSTRELFLRSRWILAGLGSGSLVWLAGSAAWANWKPLPLDQPQAMAANALERGLFLALLCGALVVWMKLRSRAGRAAAGLAMLTVFWIDYRTHVPNQNPTIRASLMQPGFVELNEFPEPGHGRVFITPEAERQLLLSRVSEFALDFVGKRLALWSNLNLLEGVPKVNGASTLRICAQAQIEDLLCGTNAVPRPNLEQFLGVKRRTAASNVTEWGLADNAMPLVTVGQRPVFVADEASLAAVMKVAFDPRVEVLLPTRAGEGPSPPAGAWETVAAEVSGLTYSPLHLEFTVRAEGSTWVVIAQTHYHRWQAFVSGESQPLWPANHAFQAIHVPSGESRVRLVYRDPLFWLGAVISLSALVGCSAVLGWRVLRRLEAVAVVDSLH
jgi:hypothetical protein